MIRKVASYSFTEIKALDDEGLVKFASSNNTGVGTNGEGDVNKVVRAEMEKRPNALFFRAKAIEADIPNNNGDAFSKSELKKAYQTFVGCPFFTNHQNQDVEKAKGKVVWAEWDDSDNAIYIVAFIDRDAYPHLCRGIEQEYMQGVSMGAIDEDAMILMADGGEKPICEVIVGDLVMTPKGNKKPVSKVHNELLLKPMYSFTLKTYHKSPLFTDDHPIMVIDRQQIESKKHESLLEASRSQHAKRAGKTEKVIPQNGWRNSDYKPQWKVASEIEPGDMMLVPSYHSIVKNKKNESESRDELFYLAGAYLGDGFVKHNREGIPEGVCFCLGLKEVLVQDRIRQVCDAVTTYIVSELEVEDRNGIYMSIYDRGLAEWMLKNFGTGAHRKRIGNIRMNRSEAQALLCGYLDTDGCIVKTKTGTGFGGFQISSCNGKLLEDIQSILVNLGYVSRLSKMERTPSVNSVVHIDTVEYTLSTGANAKSCFARSTKVSNSRLPDAMIDAGRSFITDIDGVRFMACPVVDVEVVDHGRPVWDLSIVDDECYIANGVAVHNCSVEYSECSICHNRASTVDDYCTHIRNMKGRKFTGAVKDVRTGETRQLKNEHVYENNFGIRFIELSGVADPACTTCRIDQIYKSDDFLEKAAATATGCFNSVSLLKTAMLEKNASQQDVEQLNQCLQSIEQVSVKLIQNRQNVEMDFASDLVEILASLQTFVEELVQAGYGQLPDAGIPGVAGEQQPAGAVPGTEAPLPAQPVAAEADLGGSVTGNPEEPLVNAPAAPSPLEGLNRATRPSPSTSTRGLARPTRPDRTTTTDEEKEMRIPRKHAEDRERTKSVLAGAWQEKIENFSSTLRESVQNDQAVQDGEKTGGFKMAADGIRTEAKSANADQHVITEKQLENGTGLAYHPREDQSRETVTQKQLEPERKGEQEVITEAQLEGDARTAEVREVVTEKQLDAVRKDAEKETVTQDQLGREGYRTDKEREEVTEAQLGDPKWATPWSRAAASVSNHVKQAVSVLAKAAVASGATSAEIVKAAADLASGTASKKLSVAAEIYRNDGTTESVSNVASRASYWRNKGVKVASNGTSVRESIIAYAAAAVKESDLNPETLLETFARIQGNKSTARVEAAIDGLLSAEVVEEPSIIDEIDRELVAEAATEEDKEEDDDKKVEAETSALEGIVASAAKADLGIEASVEELGVEGLDPQSPEFREAAEQFAKGACAARNIKIASIVNVTVSDDTVTIAVETNGESVEIPIGGEEEVVEEETPEEAPLPAAGAMQDAAVGGAQPPAAEDNLLSLTESKPQMKRKAQFGGGAPEVPNAGAGVAAPEDVATAPATGAELPEEGGIQTFTGEEEEELPGDEQQAAGSICPFCGSDDTETGKKDQQPGQFDCNNCGIKYLMHVNVEMLNPEEIVSENVEDDLESPEEPVLPVAAAIDIDRDTMRKLAENEKQYGISCPGCGSAEVEITEDEGLSKTVTCSKCATVSHRDFLINADNVEQGKLMVSWDLDPAKACHTCTEARKSFASDRVFNRLMKRAATIEFPVEKAKAIVEKTHGKGALVTNGPKKGELLADTVVAQLKRFGLTKVKYLEALAKAQSCEDPMDTCVKDHRLSGYKTAEARRICNCLKEEWASEFDDNIFVQAFDNMIDRGVLRKMASVDSVENTVEEVSNDEGEMNIADVDITASDEGQEIEADASKNLKLFTEEEKEEMFDKKDASAKGEKKTAAKDKGETKRDYGTFGAEKGLPRTTIEDDKDVFSGNAKMGHEDTPPDKSPDVPKAPNGGYLGHEKDAIPKGEEAKVPANSQYLGNEKKLGDEDITTKTLGLASSKSEVKTASDAPEAKNKEHMSTDGPGTAGTEYGQVESIESADDVRRGDALMGHENETIPEAAKPQVPRGDAKMGHENETIPEGAKATVPRTNESEHVETLGRVAENEQKQKLASARREKAIKLAAKMLAANAIKDDEFNQMVEDLASFSLERMEAFANRIMKSQVRTASTLPTGIVIESKTQNTEDEPDLQSQLEDMFTFGSHKADKYIKSDIAGE